MKVVSDKIFRLKVWSFGQQTRFERKHVKKAVLRLSIEGRLGGDGGQSVVFFYFLLVSVCLISFQGHLHKKWLCVSNWLAGPFGGDSHLKTNFLNKTFCFVCVCAEEESMNPMREMKSIKILNIPTYQEESL